MLSRLVRPISWIGGRSHKASSPPGSCYIIKHNDLGTVYSISRVGKINPVFVNDAIFSRAVIGFKSWDAASNFIDIVEHEQKLPIKSKKNEVTRFEHPVPKLIQGILGATHSFMTKANIYSIECKSIDLFSKKCGINGLGLVVIEQCGELVDYSVEHNCTDDLAHNLDNILKYYGH